MSDTHNPSYFVIVLVLETTMELNALSYWERTHPACPVRQVISEKKSSAEEEKRGVTIVAVPFIISYIHVFPLPVTPFIRHMSVGG